MNEWITPAHVCLPAFIEARYFVNPKLVFHADNQHEEKQSKTCQAKQIGANQVPTERILETISACQCST